MISGSQAQRIARRVWSDRKSHLTPNVPLGVPVYPVQKKARIGWVVQMRLKGSNAKNSDAWVAKVILDEDGNLLGFRIREGLAA